MVKKALSGEVFKAIPERLLQSIFMKTAVIPSANAGLLGDPLKLNISGDGTCVESHTYPSGHKTCSCQGTCSCPRKFADPEAKWGWDSYHERCETIILRSTRKAANNPSPENYTIKPLARYAHYMDISCEGFYLIRAY